MHLAEHLISWAGQADQRDVADEVLQDAYLRIWQHAARFDPTLGSPITWMAAIARNCALDAANRAARPNMSVQPELLELPFASDPLTQYERAEDAQRVHACLARLEAEQREVIVQAYCLGMSRQDIAKRTGRPVSTVKTWLRRSLAQLKSCLDEGINAECHLRNVACAAGHSPVIECAPRSTTITWGIVYLTNTTPDSILRVKELANVRVERPALL